MDGLRNKTTQEKTAQNHRTPGSRWLIPRYLIIIGYILTRCCFSSFSQSSRNQWTALLPEEVTSLSMKLLLVSGRWSCSQMNSFLCNTLPICFQSSHRFPSAYWECRIIPSDKGHRDSGRIAHTSSIFHRFRRFECHFNWTLWSEVHNTPTGLSPCLSTHLNRSSIFCPSCCTLWPTQCGISSFQV